MTPATERRLAALGWVVAAVAIALGAAGIVAGMSSPATDPDRSGRTAREDALVTRHLDAIEAELRAAADTMGELGTQARGALAALSGNDDGAAEAAIATGTTLIAELQGRLALVPTLLAAVPIVEELSAAYRLSPAVRDRYARLVDAYGTTGELGDDWTRLTEGALGANHLSTLLADHDAAVVRAAELGRAADYDGALAALDDADAAIVAARSMRDRLARTVDVTTLDEWLDRSERYDRALRALYVAVVAAGGEVTDAVREAAAEEAAAKARLPPDTRALVLIMTEIGRGGMTDAASAIEQTHADLLEALDPPLDAPAS